MVISAACLNFRHKGMTRSLEIKTCSDFGFVSFMTVLFLGFFCGESIFLVAIIRYFRISGLYSSLWRLVNFIYDFSSDRQTSSYPSLKQLYGGGDMTKSRAFFVARGFFVCFLDCLVTIFFDKMDVDFNFGQVLGFIKLAG